MIKGKIESDKGCVTLSDMTISGKKAAIIADLYALTESILKACEIDRSGRKAFYLSGLLTAGMDATKEDDE